MGLPRSGRAGWLDQPPAVNLAAARLLEALSALDGERLSAFGRKMAALGNEPRLAAMLAAAQTDDEAVTAAKLAAILEEPPRGGLVDLGAVFSRQQANWQQRSQQLMKRLARRGGQPDAGLMAGLLASAFADRIARRRGQEGATSWRTAWARCWTPTTRWAVMNGLSLRCCCRAALRRMPACCWLCQWKSAS